MKNSRRFLKTSLIYSLGIVLSKLISFALLPIYTKNIPPEAYGSYDLAITTLNFLVPITFFQIWDGLFRFSFDYKEDEGKYKISSNTYFIFMSSIPIYTSLVIIIGYLIDIPNVLLVYFFGVFYALHYLFSFLARTFMYNKLFVVSGLVNTFVTALLNIILISKYNYGVESLFVSQICGYIIQIVIIELRIRSLKKLSIKHLDKNIIKLMLKFSIPLCVATVSYWLLSGFTRLVIANELGTSANGIFSISNKFANLVVIGVSVFQYSFNEIAYLIASENNRDGQYRVMLSNLVKFILISSSIVLLVVKLMFPFLVDPTYKDAEIYIPITLLGVAANSVAMFIGTIFSSEKKTQWTFWSTIIAAGINIITVIPLASFFGLYGATLALTISFIILALIRLIVLKRKFGVKLEISIVIYMVILLSICLMYPKINSLVLILSILISIGMLSIYEFRWIFIAVLKKI